MLILDKYFVEIWSLFSSICADYRFLFDHPGGGRTRRGDPNPRPRRGPPLRRPPFIASEGYSRASSMTSAAAASPGVPKRSHGGFWGEHPWLGDRITPALRVLGVAQIIAFAQALRRCTKIRV